jgi:hypothetical protein
MPSVIDRLAEDFDGTTIPSGYNDEIRVLVTAGILVNFFVVYVELEADGSVAIFYLDID